jgi:hypothetical protein
MNRGVFSGLAVVLSNEEWRGELILRYLPYTGRLVRVLNRIYPGEDMELPVTTALYLAAMTFQPDRRSTRFAVWLRHKIRSKLDAVRRKRARARACFHSLEGPAIDRCFYYHDQVKE